MRFFKWFTSLLLLVLIGLFIQQNLHTLRAQLPFVMNLYIREQVDWTMSLFGVILLAGFIGFLFGAWIMCKIFRIRRQFGEHKGEKREAPTGEAAPVAGAKLNKDAAAKVLPPKTLSQEQPAT